MANELGDMRGLWAVRLYGIVCCLLIAIAFFICIIRGSDNHYTYLLAANIVLSGLVGVVITQWYSVGDLAETKQWFVMVFGAVLIMQSIVFDVFAFHDVSIAPSNQTNSSTTDSPINTTILILSNTTLAA